MTREATGFRSNTLTEPECYGDDSEYSEISKYCRTCSYRDACSEIVSQNVNTKSIKESTAMTLRSKPQYSWQNGNSSGRERSTSITPSRQVQTQSATPYRGTSMIKPAKYNMNKNLLPQITTYVMLDTAQSVANRSIDLIEAIRIDYEKSLLNGEVNGGENGD